MLGLLGFPNLAEALVTFFAFANLTHLRIQALELLPLCVRRHFDRALFRHERDLIVSVFVGGTVEHRSNSIADSHVVISQLRSNKTRSPFFAVQVENEIKSKVPSRFSILSIF